MISNASKRQAQKSTAAPNKQDHPVENSVKEKEQTKKNLVRAQSNQKKVEEKENLKNRELISRLIVKGFESLSLDEMAYIAKAVNFELDYKKLTGKDFPFKSKIFDRLSHANYSLRWGNKIVPSKNSAAISTPLQMFFNLIENGVVSKVNDFMKLNAKYHDELLVAQDPNKKNAMHYAVKSANIELVEFLIKKGFSVHCRDKFLKSPLHYASQAGLFHIADLLIRFKSDTEAKDNNGRTSLHLAVATNSKIVTLLLTANKNLINIVDAFGRTSLHYLIWNDNEECLAIFNILLKFKANINSVDYEGLTATHYASDSGKGKLIPNLIKAGANLYLKEKRSNRTALELSANENIRQLFLAYGDTKYIASVEDRLKLKLEGTQFNLNEEKEKELNQIHQIKELNNPRGRSQRQNSNINEAHKHKSKGKSNLNFENSNTGKEVDMESRRDKLIELMKGVQDFGLKTMKDMEKPQIYTGSWVENVKNIKDLKDRLDGMQINEAVLSIFNILNPLDPEKQENYVKELKKFDNEQQIKSYLSFFENRAKPNPPSNKPSQNRTQTPNSLFQYSSNNQAIDINNFQSFAGEPNPAVQFDSNQIFNPEVNDEINRLLGNIVKEQLESYLKMNNTESENKKLEKEAEEISKKLDSLKEKYDEHQILIDQGKIKEKLILQRTTEFNSKISQLKESIQTITNPLQSNEDLIRILKSGGKSRDPCNADDSSQFFKSVESERAIYFLFRLLRDRGYTLSNLLNEYDKDNDMFIFKQEFSQLLEDLKVPVECRPFIYKICGFDANYKLSIPKILSSLSKRESEKGYKMHELTFKACCGMLDNYISKDKFLNYLNSENFFVNEEQMPVDVNDFSNLFTNLNALSNEEAEVLFSCFNINENGFIDFRCVVEIILISFSCIEEFNASKFGKVSNVASRSADPVNNLVSKSFGLTGFSEANSNMINKTEEESLMKSTLIKAEFRQHPEIADERPLKSTSINKIKEKIEEYVNDNVSHEESLIKTQSRDELNQEEIGGEDENLAATDKDPDEGEESINKSADDSKSFEKQNPLNEKEKIYNSVKKLPTTDRSVSNKYKQIIRGELKIQVKCVDNIVLPPNQDGLNEVYLNLNLLQSDTENSDATPGLNSKVVSVTKLKENGPIGKAQFNWAARIPLINKTLYDIGSFFSLSLYLKKGTNSILLGSCQTNWTSALKQENFNRFCIDETVDMLNKRRTLIGKIEVMVKYIPAGTKESFYDENCNPIR